jgi:hypothetical protein
MSIMIPYFEFEEVRINYGEVNNYLLLIRNAFHLSVRNNFHKNNECHAFQT